MPGVAVLKPDHLGDLVLSVPAIRAIRARTDAVTLFVASGSLALARFLFPDIPDIETVDFAHLSRRPIAGADLSALVARLGHFDHLVCLRDDPVLRTLVLGLTIPATLAGGSYLEHETAIQQRAVEPVFGPYSRSRMFSARPVHWPDQVQRVALCVAAGFPTNRWPLSAWVDLADRLAARGIAITLVGGPAEADELAVLPRLLCGIPCRVVRGSADFAGFLDAIDDVDLVVATDGGTAHICSLRKPVCSIFGSSPWRRYAPFGAENLLLTRDEPCSPCVQFSDKELNGCMTRECMSAVPGAAVVRAVLCNGMELTRTHGVRVERGVSHAHTG